MPLTVAERLHRAPHGVQRDVAAELGLSKTTVSKIMRGEMVPKTPKAKATMRKVQVAVARRLRLPVDEVFPPEHKAEAAPFAAAAP